MSDVVQIKVGKTNYDKLTGIATAQVEFINPWAAENEENKNTTKTINVPINTETGQIDDDAWSNRLMEQARGVQQRMQRTAETLRGAAKAAQINASLKNISGKTTEINLAPPSPPAAEETPLARPDDAEESEEDETETDEADVEEDASEEDAEEGDGEDDEDEEFNGTL